ncbi:hypothetical protein GHT06_011063 [Daphnia sinensis]|uniref:Multiple inositol polyphosphate phosphatase 1 n=1 Tax=Daphnia sinensis TaxID=1820382 RepID=A0AAD5KZB8_9CRUS|nr:hypothetical protein GHT06_011063 [Daphnia sinensis]
MASFWLATVAFIWMTTSIGAEFLRDCHTTDPKPYIYYATKTPYELINNEDSSPIFAAGCKAVMFWMVARHGTQYPSSRDVFRMKDRLPKLRKTILQNHKERRGTLCQQDIDGLSNNGSIRIDDDFDEKLTATGREELLVLARRFRGRFADFFNSQPAFNTQDYHFRHIASLPSQSSARSFSRGIFTNGDIQLTEAPVGDRLVHFYENCTRWREQVEEKGMLEQELTLFRQSVTFQNTLADVTTRLGFQYNMSSDDMLMIYDICRYQKAWYLEQISPWCAAFTSENLKVLEFGEDLETYHKQGYGHELNYHQACPLVEDLVTRIRAFKANNGTENQQRGVFYFTEGEGLLRFIARMGLAKDEQPLTNDMTPSAERKWRTSLMGSFAANVAVVLYRCSDDYKIQLFVKEEVVHLDQCQNALCTSTEFLDYLGSVADNCGRDDGCNPSAAVITYALSQLIAISLLVITHTLLWF